MARFILANQATAAKRRVYFFLVDVTDGITPETGEGGGQPEISTNGGAFTSTGIGTLTHIGNGHYYADLTQAAVATAGDVIVPRYKSANTAEGLGDQFQIVAFDPDDAADLGLSNLDAAISSRSSHSAADVDTTLSGTHGSGSWESSSAGARTITITINDAVASPVAGVNVDIYDSGNTVFQQRLTTNVNGQAVFNLDDATYTIRQSKAQYTPDNAAETLVVTADAGVTYTGTVWTAPSASDPSLCTVWGYLLDASGAAVVNAEVRFWADVQIASGDNQIAVKSISVVTDANGYFEQDLIRSVTVYVDIKQAGYAAEAKTVPNLASQSFATW